MKPIARFRKRLANSVRKNAFARIKESREKIAHYGEEIASMNHGPEEHARDIQDSMHHIAAEERRIRRLRQSAELRAGIIEGRIGARELARRARVKTAISIRQAARAVTPAGKVRQAKKIISRAEEHRRHAWETKALQNKGRERRRMSLDVEATLDAADQMEQYGQAILKRRQRGKRIARLVAGKKP